MIEMNVVKICLNHVYQCQQLIHMNLDKMYVDRGFEKEGQDNPWVYHRVTAYIPI